MSTKVKLRYRWLGLYRIRETIVRDGIPKGTYLLEDLDGTKLTGTFPGNRLKLFYTRIGAFEKPYAPERIVETLELFKDEEEEIIGIEEGGEPKPADADETREIRPPTNDEDHPTLDTTPSFMVEIPVVT